MLSNVQRFFAGIKYKVEDCAIVLNDIALTGMVYTVPEGTAITGWKTFDGGYVLRLNVKLVFWKGCFWLIKRFCLTPDKT